MKEKEWNEGLDHLDPDLIEAYVMQRDHLVQKKKRRSLWLRLGAVAACLTLIIGAVAPIIGRDPTATPLDITRLSSPAPQYYGSDVSIGREGKGVSALIRTRDGISVTARFVEALPDVYVFYDDFNQTEFRLIRLEVLTELKGEGIPDEFLFIIPTPYMTDFSLYDKLVLDDIRQYSYEYALVHNKTQACAEQLPLMIFGSFHLYYLHESNVKAFDKLNRLDMRLWTSTEAWTESTSYAIEHTNPLCYKLYTLWQAEIVAREACEDDHPRVYSLESLSGEAADVLEDIRSMENGIYVPMFSRNYLYTSAVCLHATRYINGFATNEKVSILGKEYSEGEQDTYQFTKARFTEEDTRALPDLAAAMTAVSKDYHTGLITPPHIQNYEELGRALHGIFGWYAKTEEGVIGIVRVTWRYFGESPDRYDDAYFIVEAGSEEYRPIDRDALLEKFGEYETTYIYTGEYNEFGKVLRVNLTCA